MKKREVSDIEQAAEMRRREEDTARVMKAHETAIMQRLSEALALESRKP